MSIETAISACDAIPEYGSELWIEIAGPMFYGGILGYATGAARLADFRFRQLWVDDAEGFERYRVRVDGIHQRLASLIDNRQ